MASGLQEENFERFEKDLNFSDFFASILKNRFRLLVVSAFFLGVFLMVLGFGLFVFKSPSNDDEIKIIEESPAASGGELIVHVDGAVERPGVYKIFGGSRVADLVAAAGGLTKDADGAKINLAAKVFDGQKVYVAKIGETAAVFGATGGTTSNSSGNVSGLININAASQLELESLPAVGSVTAQKIIASRPYGSLEELIIKKVVGKSTFEKIRDLITLY